MNTKLLLETVTQNIKRQGDFFLIRVLDGSLRYQIDRDNKNIVIVDDLNVLLSACTVKLSPKDVLRWVEDFCDSDEPCSVKIFSDQKGTTCKLIIERVSGKPSMFIFGAGHVGQALALTSTLLGYEVVVVDDRAEFASRKRLPDNRIKLIVDDFGRAIRNLHIGPRCAAVIVTRGHQFDEICLENLLRSQVSYLGMIGSKRRVISIFRRLSQQGFSDSDLSRVHAPIGLSIGARSPQEIAIAILAEIIAEANKVNLNR